MKAIELLVSIIVGVNALIAISLYFGGRAALRRFRRRLGRGREADPPVEIAERASAAASVRSATKRHETPTRK